MNLNKKKLIRLSILFRKKGKIFSFAFVVILLNSCSSWVSYEDKNGNNDIIVYEDSLINIQRSTEVLGDELIISHLVNRKVKFATINFSINDISDQIENVKLKDSFSYSSSYKKYWYKNCVTCNQKIYYNPSKNIKGNQIIISTNFDFLINGKSYLVNHIDTLFKHKKYHIPQP